MIAEDAGQAVGYAVVRMRGPEESWETGPIAELETLSVLPEHRGRGIGTALMDAFHDELRKTGTRHWSVAVISANADAVRFYERQGLVQYLSTYLGRVPERGS